jgi:hypothetical protein
MTNTSNETESGVEVSAWGVVATDGMVRVRLGREAVYLLDPAQALRVAEALTDYALKCARTAERGA